MFKKLFGATDKKKQAAPEINPLETMQKLKEQIEVVDRRVKKLDVDMKAHVAAALQKKKAGDQRGKTPDSKATGLADGSRRLSSPLRLLFGLMKFIFRRTNGAETQENA